MPWLVLRQVGPGGMLRDRSWGSVRGRASAGTFPSFQALTPSWNPRRNRLCRVGDVLRKVRRCCRGFCVG